MKRLCQAALVTCCTIAGLPVAAEEHEILILRYGYYPEVLYVSPGDTIKFINQGPNWARIYSNNPYGGDADDYFDCDPDDGEVGWYTGWIPKYGSATVTVSACMQNEIEAPNIWQYQTYNGYNEAWIVFGDAPRG